MKNPHQPHNKRKHSDFAASSAHRYMNCLGSVQAIKNMAVIPAQDSSAALEGTRGHECLEYLMRRWGSLKTAEKEARLKWADDQDMVDHALKSAEIIWKLKPSKTAKLLIEQRVNLAHVTKKAKLFGTLDYAWVDPWGELVIIDYKYGMVPVLPYDDEAGEENPQLMYYASGIAKRYDYDFEKIKLAIVQPRVWAEDEDPLSEHTSKVKRIREFETSLANVVDKALRPGAPLRAGDWCRYCPAASACPEISKAQLDKAGIAFDVENGLEEKLPDVQALTALTLPKVLDAADRLDEWIGAVRAWAFQLAVQGTKIEGRKLVQKRGTRKWDDSAIKAAVEFFGEESEGAFSSQLKSPAQLEKYFGARAKGFTATFSKSVSSGVTLVRSTDRRGEVPPPNEPVFDLEVTEEKE